MQKKRESVMKQKLVLINNMIRYAQMQVKDGCYLGAILTLQQICKDIKKDVNDGVIDQRLGGEIEGFIRMLEKRYLKQSRVACPRSFVYEAIEFTV